MTVYCCSCLASMLVAYLGMRRFSGDRQRIAVVLFSALPMILVAALRYDVGTDYLHTYVPYFETVRDGFLENYSKMEILYHLLNVAIAALGGDYVWVFAIAAILFYTMVYLQIFADSPNPLLSIFLLTGMGYVFVFFNAMRQMMGCAILLYSLRYVQRRRLLPFFICVAIATGFHISCIVFIPVYWIAKIRIRPMWAFIITAIVTVLSVVIANLVLHLIGMTKYAVYLQSIFDTGKTAYVMLAINLLLLAFESVFYQNNAKYRLYYNLQLIALWTTIFSGKIVLMLRLLWVFGLPSVISLPVAMEGIENQKNRKLIASVICVLYVLYFIITVGINNSNTVLPYQTIFSR